MKKFIITLIAIFSVNVIVLADQNGSFDFDKKLRDAAARMYPFYINIAACKPYSENSGGNNVFKIYGIVNGKCHIEISKGNHCLIPPTAAKEYSNYSAKISKEVIKIVNSGRELPDSFFNEYAQWLKYDQSVQNKYCHIDM